MTGRVQRWTRAAAFVAALGAAAGAAWGGTTVLLDSRYLRLEAAAAQQREVVTELRAVREDLVRLRAALEVVHPEVKRTGGR